MIFRYIMIITLVMSILGTTDAWSSSIEQYNIGMLNFDNLTNSPDLKDYTQAIPNLILPYLMKDQKLSFVERQNLNKIVDEIMRAKNIAIMDSQTAIDIGRLAKADYIIYGGLSSFEGKREKRIHITIQIVNVSDAKLVHSWEKESSPTALDTKAIELAYDVLKTLFPPSPSSPLKAMTRSLIFGWRPNNKPSKYIFVPLTISFSGALLYSLYTYNQAENDYDKMLFKSYKTYEDYQSAKSKLDNTRQIRKVAIYCTAAVWLVNVVEAFIETRSANNQGKQKNRIETKVLLERDSVQISLDKNF